MLRYIKHEFRKVFMQQETWIALAIGFVIALVGIVYCFLEWYSLEFYSDNIIPRSKYYTAMMPTIYILFLACILASMPCACSYFFEKTNNSDIILISRIGRGKYYVAKMIVTAITGFFIAVLPLVFQYICCMITVPNMPLMYYENYGNLSYSEIIMNYSVFPMLYMNHPDLCAFVHIGIFGLWIMGMTMLTYTISLYFRKNLIVAISLSSIINLVLALIFSSIGLNGLVFSIYAYPGPGVQSNITNFPAFAIEWGVLILINIVLLGIKIRKKKDII